MHTGNQSIPGGLWWVLWFSCSSSPLCLCGISRGYWILGPGLQGVVCELVSRSDDVAQRVVLLVQREQTGVGDLRVFADADLLLSLKQQK